MDGLQGAWAESRLGSLCLSTHSRRSEGKSSVTAGLREKLRRRKTTQLRPRITCDAAERRKKSRREEAQDNLQSEVSERVTREVRWYQSPR